MRSRRVKTNGQAFYHCVSRMVEGRFIFQVSGHGSVEAERFIKLMRHLEAFSGSCLCADVQSNPAIFGIRLNTNILQQEHNRQRFYIFP